MPVQPWGLPYAAHAGGTANTDTAAVLRLPEGRKYSSHLDDRCPSARM